MNVGELLRERDRLLGVMEEAKSARSKLKQVNVLIALYDVAPGDVPELKANGKGPEPVKCPKCGAGPYKGRQGLAMHEHRIHSGRINPPPKKRKGN